MCNNNFGNGNGNGGYFVYEYGDVASPSIDGGHNHLFRCFCLDGPVAANGLAVNAFEEDYDMYHGQGHSSTFWDAVAMMLVSENVTGETLVN